MIHACYGSNCPYERWDGECKVYGNISKCPIDKTPEELEDEEAEREYWQEMKWEAEAGK